MNVQYFLSIILFFSCTAATAKTEGHDDGHDSVDKRGIPHSFYVRKAEEFLKPFLLSPEFAGYKEEVCDYFSHRIKGASAQDPKERKKELNFILNPSVVAAFFGDPKRIDYQMCLGYIDLVEQLWGYSLRNMLQVLIDPSTREAHEENFEQVSPEEFSKRLDRQVSLKEQRRLHLEGSVQASKAIRYILGCSKCME